LLLISLCISAQNKTVKEANAFLKSNKLTEAEKAIDKALANEETKNLPKTWDVAGRIQKRIHETENQKAYLRKKYDTLLLYSSALKMTKYFMTCDSLAQIPDAKGKVKNKFRKDNAESIYNERINLVNGGYHYMGSDKEADRKKAIDYLDTYIVSGYHPMMERYNLVQTDSLIANVGYYASVTALKDNDYEAVSKYGTYALSSPTFERYAMQLLSTAYLQQKDTVNYLNILKEGIAKYPNDRFFFANIIDFYIRTDRIEEAMAISDVVLSENPSSPYVLYVIGYLYQTQKKYEQAIEIYQDAIKADPEIAEAYSGLGLVYCILAQEYSANSSPDINSPDYARDQQIIRDYYMKAKEPYEKARELRPNEKELWLNGLYRVYYNLNMGKQFNEIEELLNSK